MNENLLSLERFSKEREGDGKMIKNEGKDAERPGQSDVISIQKMIILPIELK